MEVETPFSRENLNCIGSSNPFFFAIHDAASTCAPVSFRIAAGSDKCAITNRRTLAHSSKAVSHEDDSAEMPQGRLRHNPISPVRNQWIGLGSGAPSPVWGRQGERLGLAGPLPPDRWHRRSRREVDKRQDFAGVRAQGTSPRANSVTFKSAPGFRQRIFVQPPAGRMEKSK